jgi:hypothetical protein
MQWDETLVLALAGMSRLLRAHLRTLLAVLPRFQDGWQELMLVVESSMAGGRHETAVAAVALLTNVLQVAASAGTLSKPYPIWTKPLALIAVWACRGPCACMTIRAHASGTRCHGRCIKDHVEACAAGTGRGR